MLRFFRAVLPSIFLALSVGQIYAFTLFSDSIAQHLSTYDNFVSKAQVQFSFSLSIFFIGLGAAVFGGFVEKHLRLSTLLGTSLFLLGLLLTEMGIASRSLTLIYVGYGFFVGVGTGTIYISPVKTMMLWFPRHKAMAAALPIILFGLGSTLSAILYNGIELEGSELGELFSSVGIKGRGITHVFAWFAAFYAVPMYLAGFLIGRPKESLPTKKETFSYRRLFFDPPFIRCWLFMFVNISCGLCLIPLAKQMMTSDAVGYSDRTIMAIIILSGVANAVGRLAFAWWSDHLANRINVLLAIIAIPFGVMTLSVFPVTIGIVLLVINACYGAGFSVIPAIIESIYGIDDLSKIHGAVLSAWGLAGLVGNQMAILVSDELGFGNLGVIALIITLYALNYMNVDSLKRAVAK